MAGILIFQGRIRERSVHRRLFPTLARLCPVEPRGLSCRRVRGLVASAGAVIAESSEAARRQSVEEEDFAGRDGLSGEFDDSL
jgi:hypothetical protein